MNVFRARGSKRVLQIKQKEMIQRNQNRQAPPTNQKAPKTESGDQSTSSDPNAKSLATKTECEPESKEPEDPPSSDAQSNDLVFPCFDSVSYRWLSDKFTIALPPYLRRWLVKLLDTINQSDIAQEVHAFAWMVLLYPSLLLLQDADDNLDGLVDATLAKMRSFMLSEAESDALELNNALICAELFAHRADEIPPRVWRRLNELMEPASSLPKFLKIACSRAKEEKAARELAQCSAAQAMSSKTRDKWMSFVGVYTQMCRLHRLREMHGERLSALCRANIAKMTRVCEERYCAVLRSLLEPLKRRSDAAKLSYCYYRYKTMAMCTHSPTSIVPTFAGQMGVVESAASTRLWRVMVDALHDDVRGFVESVARVVSAKQKGAKGWKGVAKMPKKERRHLRILDHVCYNSLCALLMFQSVRAEAGETDKASYARLLAMRAEICDAIGRLADNGMLFVEEMTGLDHDVLDSCFLTDDSKEGKEDWSVHLMSGVLLNFWNEKTV